MSHNGQLSLDEILQLGGAAFVTASYQAILGREPDQAGLLHHLDLLTRGESKLRILIGLTRSPERAQAGAQDTAVTLEIERRSQSSAQRLLRLFLPGPSSPRQTAENSVGGMANAGEAPHSAPDSAPQTASDAPYVIEEIEGEEWQRLLDSRRLTTDGQLWLDLTTSIQWQMGVVGIIRAELEMANNLKKVMPALRFSMQAGAGFVEIPEEELTWLLEATNVAEAYMEYFGRNGSKSRKVRVKAPRDQQYYHPYGPNDTVFSMGWKDSDKERIFNKIKPEITGFRLGYLIYDIIMLRPETEHFYAEADRKNFEAYLRWISYNCDFLLFGGENTKRDVEECQRKRRWPVLPGRAIRFGSDIVDTVQGGSDEEHLRDLGITGPFILSVGTAEPRKNYATLYRAYVLAQELSARPLPQLVICGQDGHRIGNLSDQLARDPRVAGRILRRRPSDDQLAALYRNCQFTLLPSFYEGWSLTLPESFAYDKLCICANSPPLRETGRDLAVYIDPLDVRAWSEAIITYSQDAAELEARTARIREEWEPTSWADCSRLALAGLTDLRAIVTAPDYVPPAELARPTIWMDLSLSYLNWNSALTGVTRVELMYAKMLRQLEPSTRFFAADSGRFFEIHPSYLTWMDDDEDLSKAYNGFNSFWQDHEGRNLSYRSPFKTEQGNGCPELHQFPSRSIIFLSGIDFGHYDVDGKPVLSYTHKIRDLVPSSGDVILTHFMHDFTPSDWPHIHKSETVEGYEPFCDYVCNNFDFLVYGGYTAQRDGEALMERRKWTKLPGKAVTLGFDIASPQTSKPENDAAYLASLGIVDNYVLAVGTLEPRKNHETLYRAYLLMLDRGLLDRPLQMVFVGKRGWNNDDFLSTLDSDRRVKGRIVVAHPSDEGLGILYRQSRFTLLPSFYEGWSLPLPESLAHGKFCLVSDTPPLRERGGAFAEYIHPLDAARWAERIAHYANNPAELVPIEHRISSEWHPISWQAATLQLLDELHTAYGQLAIKGGSAKSESNDQ